MPWFLCSPAVQDGWQLLSSGGSVSREEFLHVLKDVRALRLKAAHDLAAGSSS